MEKINYDNLIQKLLTQNCCHHYNGYNRNDTAVCNEICAKIKECHQDGLKISDQTFNLLMEYITNQTRYGGISYAQYRCINKNQDNLVKLLEQLFKYHIPNPLHIEKLIDLACYDICYISLMSNNKYKKIENSTLDIIIKQRLKYSYYLNSNEETNNLVDFVIKFVDMSLDNLSKLVSCKNEYLSFILSSIIDKSNLEFNDNSILYAACHVLPYSKHVIQSLIGRGLRLDSKCLEIVCLNCPLEGIKYILENGRINVMREHYHKLVESVIDTNLIEHRFLRRHKLEINESIYTQEKMELLINYGYIPDYEDIIYSIKHKIEIPNISRFNIKLDQKMLELCWEVDFYPKYKFDCIDLNLLEMQKLCLQKNSLTKIKNLVEYFNIIPDRKCMENACCQKSNSKVVDYLISKKGKITGTCVKNCISKFNGAEFLLDIFNNYEKNNTELITKLQNHIIQLGGSLDDVKMTKVDNVNNINKLDNDSDKQVNNINKNINDEENFTINKEIDDNDAYVIHKGNVKKKMI